MERLQAFSSEFDLGNLPLTDIGVTSTEFCTYSPMYSIKDPGNPVEYAIPGSNNLYIDTDSAELHVRARISKADGSKLSSTDNVAPCCNFFRGLFHSCEVQLNSTPVSSGSGLLPYRGHITDTISHGEKFKSGQLAAQLYIKDTTPGSFATTNLGYIERLNIAKESRVFELVGKISASIFETGKVLPPDVSVRIILKRSEPQFCLDSPTEPLKAEKFPYIIEFEECTLYVRKFVVNPKVVAIHHRILNSAKGRFAYPLKNIELRTFNITTGIQQILSENLFRGTIPRYVILTFIDSAAINGNIQKSCFRFQPFDIQNIKLITDGERTTYREIKIDIESNQILLAFNSILTAFEHKEAGLPITKEEFLDGSFMVVLELQPGHEISLVDKKLGNVQVELKFKKPLESSVTCLVLGMMQSIMYIDKNRNVTIE